MFEFHDIECNEAFAYAIARVLKREEGDFYWRDELWNNNPTPHKKADFIHFSVDRYCGGTMEICFTVDGDVNVCAVTSINEFGTKNKEGEVVPTQDRAFKILHYFEQGASF